VLWNPEKDRKLLGIYVGSPPAVPSLGFMATAAIAIQSGEVDLKAEEP